MAFPSEGEGGEWAVIAGRGDMITKITDDLEKALLMGSTGEATRATKKTLTSEFQDTVVLRGRPTGVSVFDAGEEDAIFSGVGSGVKPRQDGIYGEVGGAGGAEQWTRLGLSCALEGPVVDPKFVGLDPQDFREGGCEFGFWTVSLEPGLQAGKEVVTCQPVGEEGETASGVIGWTQAGEAPEGLRKLMPSESVAFAPPVIPELAEMLAGSRGLGREVVC